MISRKNRELLKVFANYLFFHEKSEAAKAYYQTIKEFAAWMYISKPADFLDQVCHQWLHGHGRNFLRDQQRFLGANLELLDVSFTALEAALQNDRLYSAAQK
jgi:hypothetical protein